MQHPRLDRRRFLALIGAASLAPLAIADRRAADSTLLSRPIPASGERIPVVGMGSYITFDVADSPELLAQRTEVLRAFFEAGGRLVDSSPMYGSSEAAIGQALATLGHPPALFSATKVWHWLTESGKKQMARSRGLWGIDRLDLMQVHNLVSWPDHLATMRRDRERGLIRYIGITTSHGRRHDELLEIMRTEPIDFVQFTYNIVDREAEERLLPLAADRGIAVIINRPFQRKRLIRRFEGRPLPGWAADIGCRTWAQFLLKFIVSHPAVTCAIPATTRVDHMRENMAVLGGPLPDDRMRDEMIRYTAVL